MKNTSLTAIGGIITALSVFIMFLTGILPFLSYALPALAGALLIIPVFEANKKWSFLIFAATALLSMLLVSNKEAAILYLFFFGYYVILKAAVEEKLPKALQWVVKILVFNVSVVIAYYIIIYVFAIPVEELEEYGRYSAYILMGMGNVVFVIYDYALTKLILNYRHHWHDRIKKMFNK